MSDDITTAAVPEPPPQSECAFYHRFDSELVQGALRRLWTDIRMNGTKAPRMKDIAIVLVALERNRQHHGI